MYRFFPPYNLGRGLISLSALDLEASLGKANINPFQWNVIGQPLFFMCAEAFGYMILTLLIDSDTLSRAFRFFKACIYHTEEQLRQSFSGISWSYNALQQATCVENRHDLNYHEIGILES